MRSAPYLHILAFAGLVLGGARLSDTLIHYTVPDDPCHDALMAITVTYFSVVLLISLAYLGVLVLTVVNRRAPRWIRGRTWPHTFGCATLCFSALSPFIVLHGPQSGVAYGERVAVTEALGQAIAAREAAEHFWATRHRFPAGAAEAGWDPRIHSVSTTAKIIDIDAEGVITIHFRSARYKDLDQHTLVLTPAARPDGLAWDCRGGTLPDFVRPALCRRHVICRVWH